jgi:arabinose-5-phosphate isomerase
MKFDLAYARKVIESEAEAVKGLVKMVGPEFARAAEMIYQCNGSCIVSGIGKAGIIGRKISATLASTGTPSHFLHPAEAVHGDLGKISRDDVIIVISKSGETKEVVDLLPIFNRLGVKLISLTGAPDSTIGTTTRTKSPSFKNDALSRN